MRQHVGGSPRTARVGHSRAVRVGNVGHGAGTTATVNGAVVGVRDAYEQTCVVLEMTSKAPGEAGTSLEDGVQTRIFITDNLRRGEVGRAPSEVFGAVRPAATMVEVAALIDPQPLAEIPAEAIVP